MSPHWPDLAQGSLMWIAFFCFGLAVASALLPWVNAELMLLAASSSFSSPAGLVVIVIAVTMGQVGGKSALYWLAREARLPLPVRAGIVIQRWRDSYGQRPVAAQAMLLASATLGLPPFYLTTLIAGTLRIRFGAFLAAAVVGRLVHFGVIALVPGLARGMFH